MRSDWFPRHTCQIRASPPPAFVHTYHQHDSPPMLSPDSNRRVGDSTSTNLADIAQFHWDIGFGTPQQAVMEPRAIRSATLVLFLAPTRTATTCLVQRCSHSVLTRVQCVSSSCSTRTSLAQRAHSRLMRTLTATHTHNSVRHTHYYPSDLLSTSFHSAT